MLKTAESIVFGKLIYISFFLNKIVKLAMTREVADHNVKIGHHDQGLIY